MPRILSVEDDPDFQHLVSYALRSQGFEVHSAFTGPEGHQKALALLPDLILMDLMLPGLNGLEVLTLLKQREKTRDIPVIVLTAYSEDAAFEKDLKALGAFEYLSKPIRFDALIRLVRRILFERTPVARPHGKCYF